jgi:hypothetical protein
MHGKNTFICLLATLRLMAWSLYNEVVEALPLCRLTWTDCNITPFVEFTLEQFVCSQAGTTLFKMNRTTLLEVHSYGVDYHKCLSLIMPG